MPPSEFIPAAEKAGLIHELGAYVFDDVCRIIIQRGLAARGIKYIDINLSIYQFLRDDLVDVLEGIRKKWDVPPERINLEITEGTSYEEAPSVRETITKMRSLGYSFSIDDYGTGFSSLSRLLEEEYSNIKIDKSILWSGENDPQTHKLLDNLIGVIRSMDKNVVQEGVETEEQLERVVKAGANLIQGYYFSKPLKEIDFLAYVDHMNGNVE